MANRFIILGTSTSNIVTSRSIEKVNLVKTRVNEIQVAINKSSPLNYHL